MSAQRGHELVANEAEILFIHCLQCLGYWHSSCSVSPPRIFEEMMFRAFIRLFTPIFVFYWMEADILFSIEEKDKKD